MHQLFAKCRRQKRARFARECRKRLPLRVFAGCSSPAIATDDQRTRCRKLRERKLNLL